MVLNTAGEEAMAWCMAGAKGPALLTGQEVDRGSS
jgi:hypothetical protein